MQGKILKDMVNINLVVKLPTVTNPPTKKKHRNWRKVEKFHPVTLHNLNSSILHALWYSSQEMQSWDTWRIQTSSILEVSLQKSCDHKTS